MGEKMRCVIVLLFFLYSLPVDLLASIGKEQFIFKQGQTNYFPLVVNGQPISILIDDEDKGVLRAVNNLRNDFNKVTGNFPAIEGASKSIIIGTVNKSVLIDKLIKKGKINGSEIINKNEKYIITNVLNPIEGIEEAIIIVGSDKRGTIYGIYELSSQIGVSPWYYWADVPIKTHKNLFFKPGFYTEGEPAVTYRGIFLNDEWPALGGWAQATFGGFNSQFYEKVFELILRLKGNFLWPAMWNSAFYDDDPLNGSLADEYGIIMSTSHHEPMSQAQKNWHRRGKGEWNYKTNSEVLKEFWRSGIERSKNWEQVITIGMRGDGDEAMEETTNISLLEKIVKDQRKIISQVTGKKAEEIPQVWALYKEVQDYYDHGMRVPDDVTLLFCDDNWGNVRKLPSLKHKKRKGGYGMYYHFDYVGAPRNSKWINVSQVQRIWEQMNLTYRYGVDRIWVVNVGDLKPMEYPISFFLDMAWNPDRFNESNLLQHTQEWCKGQFGEQYAKESARLINTYTKYNHRVTPELLNETTYSLYNYNEYERVVNDYRNLLIDAMRLYYLMPHEYRDAFDQLVLFPINGSSNLYEMYYSVAMNKHYAKNKDAKANYWADKVKECFQRDSLLTIHYNQNISDGKWMHMMDQVRIGYTSWQQPDQSIMPKVVNVKAQSLNKDKVFIERDGYVSIEAEHYAKANNSEQVSWITIPNLGKTLSGVTTTPVIEKPDENVYLKYKVEITTTGEVEVLLLLSPTLNFNENKGLSYAISINDGEEQIVNINGHYRGELGVWQANRIIETKTNHNITQPGLHTVRFRPLDPAIVIQKIMLNMGGLESSYLGAPESDYIYY